MFHVKVKDLTHLRSILGPMGRSEQYSENIVIIDSLSHLIQGGERETFTDFQHVLEDVVSGVFTPIISAATHKHVRFIILHHFAYNPKLEHSFPVAFDLMQNLPGMWAMLNFDVCTEKYDLTLEFWVDRQLRTHKFSYLLTPSFFITEKIKPPPMEDPETDDA